MKWDSDDTVTVYTTAMLALLVLVILVLSSCTEEEKPEAPKHMELHIACMHRSNCDAAVKLYEDQDCTLQSEQKDAIGRIVQVYICLR